MSLHLPCCGPCGMPTPALPPPGLLLAWPARLPTRRSAAEPISLEACGLWPRLWRSTDCSAPTQPMDQAQPPVSPRGDKWPCTHPPPGPALCHPAIARVLGRVSQGPEPTRGGAARPGRRGARPAAHCLPPAPFSEGARSQLCTARCCCRLGFWDQYGSGDGAAPLPCPPGTARRQPAGPSARAHCSPVGQQGLVAAHPPHALVPAQPQPRSPPSFTAPRGAACGLAPH